MGLPVCAPPVSTFPGPILDRVLEAFLKVNPSSWKGGETGEQHPMHDMDYLPLTKERGEDFEIPCGGLFLSLLGAHRQADPVSARVDVHHPNRDDLPYLDHFVGVAHVPVRELRHVH